MTTLLKDFFSITILCTIICFINCEEISAEVTRTRKQKFDSLFEDFLLKFEGPKPLNDFYTVLAYYLFVQEVQRLVRQPSLQPVIQDSSGLPCGAVRKLQLNDELIIESPNFSRNDKYPNSFSCDWKFTFPRCSLIVSCPTFRLNDFLCLDYLEIKDSSGKSRRFCGQNGPTVKFVGGYVEFTFRTSTFFRSVGFRCNLRCVEPDPLPPLNNVPPINCGCGERPQKFKIVNGQETEVGEFPWMALLLTIGLRRPFCGGTLINDRYILTAAHCVRNPNREIILNEHNIGDETGSTAQTVKIDKIIQHELFNLMTRDYDIAVIKLAEPIDLTNSIVPVCLPRDRGQSYTGNRATISGWGLTSEDAPDPSNTLQKTDTTIVTNEECSRVYHGRPDPIFITPRMMCSYEPGKDACLYDSGGPLMVHDEVRSTNENVLNSNHTYDIRNISSKSNSNALKYTQVGVISFGDGCARPGIPAVYSRLTEYMDWILRVTADGSFCKF